MTTHKEPVVNEFRDDESSLKKKKYMYIAIAIIAIIAISIALFVTIRQNKQEEGASEGQTAETITQSDTPTAQPQSRSAETATTTLPDGSESTYLKAPPHLGLPDDVAVDRGVAEHQEGDPIPADPREGVKQTLTAPTTVRAGDMESPQLNDPAVGEPEFLAQSFFNSALSMCVRPDNSYNKNINDKFDNLVTEDFKKRGLLSWGNGDHSTEWKSYQTAQGCNKLTSFPSVNGSSVGGPNIMYYDVTVNQRIDVETVRGGVISNDITPFRGQVRMKFVDNKWLVDDFQVNGRNLPTLR